jgi:hypothetical protein
MISAANMTTIARAGRSGFRIAAGMRDLSVLQNVQTNSGDHTAYYSLGTSILSDSNVAETSNWPLIST